MAGDLVLLTGATGMIGFRVLVLLLEAGYRVRAAVRNQAGFDRIAALKSVVAHVSRLESIIVPDITVPGAYDQAVRGVKFVVHVASPLAHPQEPGTDLEAVIVQPAIQGAVGMLESASKEPGIERVVMTGSVASLTAATTPDDVVDEKSRAVNPKGPYNDVLQAYFASKKLSFNAVQDFMVEKKPSFTLINVMPTYVIGRDEQAANAKALCAGSNSLVLGPLLGIQIPGGPFHPWTCHLEDVATLHVKSLDSAAMPGNRTFIISSRSEQRKTPWSGLADIVRRHYPKQVTEGIFDVETAASLQDAPGLIDSSVTEKALGITFKTFEEAVTSLLDYYLELSGQK